MMPDAPPFSAPEPVLVSDHVGAWYLPGTGRNLVVTFGGIGADPKQAPGIEFLGTAHAGGANHVLAINDMRRTWYSQPQVLAEVDQAFAQVAERVQPEQVFGLGNSMGGYGALLFAKPMGFTVTIACAPQFSMRPDVVNEPRWPEYRVNFGPALAEDLTEAMAQVPGTAWILHGTMGPDIRHFSKMPYRANIHHALFPGGAHGIAIDLRERGFLVPFVNFAFAGEVEAAKQSLAALQPLWRGEDSAADLERVHEIRKAIHYFKAVRQQPLQNEVSP